VDQIYLMSVEEDLVAALDYAHHIEVLFFLDAERKEGEHACSSIHILGMDLPHVLFRIIPPVQEDMISVQLTCFLCCFATLNNNFAFSYLNNDVLLVEFFCLWIVDDDDMSTWSHKSSKNEYILVLAIKMWEVDAGQLIAIFLALLED